MHVFIISIDLFLDKITPAVYFYNNTYSTFTELELRIRKNDRTFTFIILKFNEIVVPHIQYSTCSIRLCIVSLLGKLYIEVSMHIL